MKKNEIIELLKPKCNGYDLPLSLNIGLIAEMLVNKQEAAINYTRCCEELCYEDIESTKCLTCSDETCLDAECLQ